jgi:hypothetical protein
MSFILQPLQIVLMVLAGWVRCERRESRVRDNLIVYRAVLISAPAACPSFLGMPSMLYASAGRCTNCGRISQ